MFSFKLNSARRNEGGKSVWNTVLIFLILGLLTVAMAIALKGMITGSMKPL